ncbi:hypothetical protein BDR05DRAFT_985905 [Suillus weaverae]|nr:hypothetical protein BDR05DRAFT_985905 [Suillus weaverae]
MLTKACWGLKTIYRGWEEEKTELLQRLLGPCNKFFSARQPESQPQGATHSDFCTSEAAFDAIIQRIHSMMTSMTPFQGLIIGEAYELGNLGVTTSMLSMGDRSVHRPMSQTPLSQQWRLTHDRGLLISLLSLYFLMNLAIFGHQDVKHKATLKVRGSGNCHSNVAYPVINIRGIFSAPHPSRDPWLTSLEIMFALLKGMESRTAFG